MRVRSRVLAAACAAMLAVTSLTTPAAAEEPSPEPTMVYCPPEADMVAILGYTFYQVGISANGCSYVKIDGNGVRFSFDEFGYTLGNLRESSEGAGKPVVDVPELGAGAFSYVDDGTALLYWNDGEPDGRLYSLYVPAAQQDLALSLAKLFIAAIKDPPAPTVPAKAFTLTCPTARQVSQVVGRTVVLDPGGQTQCTFKGGEEGISFSTVKGYGSIFDYRDRVQRDVSREPAMNTAFSYFAGLTPGAFLTVDLGPVSLRWQLEEGVIAQMYASEKNDVLIRLAELLKSVQGGPGKPGNPGKPGLPSTGD